MDTTAMMSSITGDSSAQAAASNGVFMGMTMWGLILSVAFAIIGFLYFRYGKVTTNFRMIICGIALMAFPYVVTNTLYMAITGAVLTALPHILDRFS